MRYLESVQDEGSMVWAHHHCALSERNGCFCFFFFWSPAQGSEKTDLDARETPLHLNTDSGTRIASATTSTTFNPRFSSVGNLGPG